MSLTRDIPNVLDARPSSGAARPVKMCIIRMPPASHWSQSSTLFHAANRQQAPVHLNGAEACLGQGAALVRCNRPSPVVEPAPHPLCCEGRKAGSYCAVEGPGNNSSWAGYWGWDLQKKMGSRNIALQTEVMGTETLHHYSSGVSPAPTSVRSLDRWAIGVPCSYRRFSLLSQSAYCQLRCLMGLWALKCGICRVGWGARCNVTLRQRGNRDVVLGSEAGVLISGPPQIRRG